MAGTGSGQPAGLLSATTLGVTGGLGVGGAPTADNLIDLYHSLAAPYARSKSAAWFMRSSTLGAVRKLKDNQNRYLFDINAPYGSGADGTLLGRPVYVDPNVPAIGLGAKSVVFGDISRYWVRSVNGVRFEQSLDYAFNQDLITFRSLWRADGVLVDQTGAVKHFIGGAS
jgi:HK97 family phage major capsid protein